MTDIQMNHLIKEKQEPVNPHADLPVVKYTKSIALAKSDSFLAAHEAPVVIQEKIDGSNVSIRNEGGEMVLQSRNTIINQNAPGSFNKFVTWAQEWWTEKGHKALPEDAILYGEMVGMGKLRYDSAPPFLLFDGYDGRTSVWFTPMDLERWANDWGVPMVKNLFVGPYPGSEFVQSLLGKSDYGTCDREGVVVKGTNVTCWYEKMNDEGTAMETVKYTEPLLVAKFVRADFQETAHPKSALDKVSDPLQAIVDAVVTPARIEKAKQQAIEAGVFDPKKPHTLIKFVAKDVHDEERAYVSELLFEAFWKEINGKLAKKVATSA